MLRAGQEDDLCRVERAQMRLRKASLSTGEENRAILSNIFMRNISSSTRAVLKEREMEGFQVYPLMSVVCGGFTPGTPVSTDCINYDYIISLYYLLKVFLDRLKFF